MSYCICIRDGCSDLNEVFQLSMLTVRNVNCVSDSQVKTERMSQSDFWICHCDSLPLKPNSVHIFLWLHLHHKSGYSPTPIHPWSLYDITSVIWLEDFLVPCTVVKCSSKSFAILRRR